MFIRIKTSPNSPRQSIQIVRSQRFGKTVKQVIVRHVGVAFNDREKEELVRLGKIFIRESLLATQPELPLDVESSELVEKPVSKNHMVDIHGCHFAEEMPDGFTDVVKLLFSNIGFTSIFGLNNHNKARTNALFGCVLSMIAKPCSKLSTSKWLKESAGLTISVDRIYRMMTMLEKKISKVKEIVSQSTLKLCEHRVTLMLYDVTTLYFESFVDDGFRQSGWSKENKTKETQVVLALATNRDGLPLWYEIFPGKKWEGHTLLESFERFKERLSPENTVIVADRAMFTAANLEKAEELGFSYVVGAKLRSLPKPIKDKILDHQDYQSISWIGKNKKQENDNSFKVKAFDYGEKRKLLVSWSKKRSLKDKKDRERIVERARKILGESESIAGGGLIKNSGTKRYLKKADKKDSEYILDEEKIRLDSLWDGFHGVITNIQNIQPSLSGESINQPPGFSISEIFSFYHNLWRIEESFRLNKSDLKIRPIRHRTERRIRAHIAVCYITYAISRQIEYQVRLQKKENISFARIRSSLNGVKSAIIYDAETSKIYRLPKELDPDAKKIYSALGIKRSHVPSEVSSVSKLRNRILF